MSWDRRYELLTVIADDRVISYDDYTGFAIHGTWHEIWPRLPPPTRFALIRPKDSKSEIYCVDVPTSMKDDLSRVYLGKFTIHASHDAALMYAMMMKGTKPDV